MVQRLSDLSEGLSTVWRRSQDWYRRQVARRAEPDACGSGASEGEALLWLRDAQPSRRWQAAALLRRSPHGSHEALKALTRALADAEPFVRWEAARALAAQDAGTVFPLLRAALAQGDPLVRAGAAQALGHLGGEGASLELRKALRDADARVRAAAAHALGACGDPTAAPAVERLLDDRDAGAVCAAASALGRIGNPGFACTLADVLARPGQPLLVRRALAAALARLPHPEVQQVLLWALDDPDPQVRGYAAQALGQVGDEAAWQALARLRRDDSPLLHGTVGEQAGRAQALLERHGQHVPPATSASSASPANGASADGAEP